MYKRQDETIEGIRKTIPELPLAKARRLEEKYGLPAEDSRFLANNREIADYFEECCRYYDKPKNIANWIMGDFSALLNKERITIKAVSYTHLLSLPAFISVCQCVLIYLYLYLKRRIV